MLGSNGMASMLFSQAHFSAPSSERRKLMSAPLSAELRKKHQVRLPRARRMQDPNGAGSSHDVAERR